MKRSKKTHPTNPNADLYSKSASQMADQQGVSRRTIQRRRRALKDQIDPESQRATMERKSAEAFRRFLEQQVRQRGAYARVMQPPTRTGRIGEPREIDELSRFVTALPQATQFVLAGGTREILYWDTDAELDIQLGDVVDQYLPPNDDMAPWIYLVAHDKPQESFQRDLNLIAAHPSTIGWALHAPDNAHCCLHAHILSSMVVDDYTALRRHVGGAGAFQTIHSSGSAFLSYLDCNTRRKSSLTGVHFGPAAAAEVRVLQSLASLWVRIGASQHNIDGLLDVAEIITSRLATRRFPTIPRVWIEWVRGAIDPVLRNPPDAMLLETARYAAMAMDELIRLAAQSFTPLKWHLGRSRYYEDVWRERPNGQVPKQSALTEIAARSYSQPYCPAALAESLGLRPWDSIAPLNTAFGDATFNDVAFVIGEIRFRNAKDRITRQADPDAEPVRWLARGLLLDSAEKVASARPETAFVSRTPFVRDSMIYGAS